MKVSEIRKVLYDLERIYAAAGAKVPANDMSELADAMAAADDQDANVFLADLEKRMSLDTDPEARAEHHLLALMDAGIDRVRFRKAFEAIKADKAMKGPQLDKIGSAYAMSPKFALLYKTRNQKLDQIEQTFHDKKNFEDRGKVIDELLPWQ